MVSSVLCQPTKCMSKLLFHFALLCIMYNITFLSHFSDDDDDGYPAEFFAGNLETKIYCINIEEYVTLAIDEVDTNCWSRWIPSDTSQIVRTIPWKTTATSLFQSVLASGKLLDKLKEGIICPIHKGGSRADVKHYSLSL